MLRENFMDISYVPTFSYPFLPYIDVEQWLVVSLSVILSVS